MRQRPSAVVVVAHLVASLAVCASPSSAEDWPQFRGPDGQGHSSETGLPVQWSENSHIAWRTPIAGQGWSSPVVQGDQIWLTTAEESSGALRAICLDRESGEFVHDVEVFRKANLGRIAAKNSHASPTPVLDGDRVYVHFGAHGTACLTTAGRVLWRVELAYDHRHGPGGSPVVWNDLLILSCDGPDLQYVVALDGRTGEVRWRTERDGQSQDKMAYSTPLVIRSDGGDQLLSVGGGALVSYDPSSGQELWRCRHDGHSVVPRPVFGHGFVYFSSGYWSPTLYAVRPDGRGDVTDTHVASMVRRGAPHNPSPLLVGDDLWLVSDMGIVTCLDALTGEEYWRQRLPGAFSASPVFADGRVYLSNEDGATTVLAAGRAFRKLAVNQVEGRTLASLAISDGRIFLRTDRALYCIR